MFRIITAASFLFLSGCVAQIPLEDQTPDLTYHDPDTIMISVIDHRALTREGMEPDVIGVAHGTFGIPSDMKVYPWYENDKAKKDITLAQALEERIVFGLNDENWSAVAAGFEVIADLLIVGQTCQSRALMYVSSDG